MRISTTFAEVDWVCDYIPLVSTISNVVDLFLKCVCNCLPETVAKNRYWTHIKQKDLFRCFILLIPLLGNIYVLICDYFEYKEEKTSCDLAIQDYQKQQRSTAAMLARFATQTSGLEVTAKQMMPTPIEDQERLWIACFENDVQSVRELLDRGTFPNFHHGGISPLVVACQHGTAESVRLLVDAGATVTTPDQFGNSPFTVACAKGNLEMVQALYPGIHDINTPNANGVTPLMFASMSGQQNVVEFLIAQGANKTAVAPDGSDALSRAIFSNDYYKLLDLLLPEDVDARRYQTLGIKNLSLLLYAILFKAENSALYLIGRSKVGHLDSTHSHALHYSSSLMSVLQAVLEKCHTPEFVNQPNIVGSTPLHRAIELDRSDAALLLLENGANPFLPDQAGNIPFILAYKRALVNVVNYIEQYYANQITPEIQEQAAVARREQATQPQPESPDLLSLGIGLQEIGLKGMASVLEGRVTHAKEIENLGPPPRAGMEIFLGRHPWPVW